MKAVPERGNRQGTRWTMVHHQTVVHGRWFILKNVGGRWFGGRWFFRGRRFGGRWFWWTTVWWTMVLVDGGFGERWFWWTMVLVDAGFGERWFAAFKIIKNIKDFQESVHEFSKIFACGGQLSGGLFFILCTGSSLVTFLLPICKLCDHLLSTVENPLYF